MRGKDCHFETIQISSENSSYHFGTALRFPDYLPNKDHEFMFSRRRRQVREGTRPSRKNSEIDPVDGENFVLR